METIRVKIHQTGLERGNLPIIEQNCTVIHHNGNSSIESNGAESNNLQNGFHTEPNGNYPALNAGPIPKHNGEFDQFPLTLVEEELALIPFVDESDH